MLIEKKIIQYLQSTRHKLQDSEGITLVLVLGLLGAVLGLGLVASNLVLRESVSVSGIEQSEVAYYAAEAGAESRLYMYNKALPRAAAIELVDTCDALINNLDVITEAYWKEIGLTLDAPNPWPQIDLTGGNTTFELYLDLELEGGPNGLKYPNKITITRSYGGSSVTAVLFKQEKNSPYTESQEVFEGSSPLIIPETGNFDFNTYYYRMKISDPLSDGKYTISPIPQGDSSVVIVRSIKVTTCGVYKSSRFERQVEINHPKWVIY